MIAKLLQSVPLFDVLVRVDRDIAEKAWKGPCPIVLPGSGRGLLIGIEPPGICLEGRSGDSSFRAAGCW